MTNSMKIGLTVAGVAVAVGVGYMIYKKMNAPKGGTSNADGGCGCNGKKMNASGSTYTSTDSTSRVTTVGGGTKGGQYKCYDSITKTYFMSDKPCTSYNTQ